MAKIKIHAGDFKKGDMNSFGSVFGQGSFTLLSSAHPIMGETISITKVDELDLASEDSVKRMGGTVGWGVAGGVLLGPAGLLAGLLLGGKGKEITFICKFKDGRKFMGTIDAKGYKQIQASLMDAPKQARLEEFADRAEKIKQQKAHEKKYGIASNSRKELSKEEVIRVIKWFLVGLSVMGVLITFPTSTAGAFSFFLASILLMPPVHRLIVDKLGRASLIFTGIGVLSYLGGCSAFIQSQ